MFKVLTLNNIAKIGLSRLPASAYQIANDVKDPDAILLRSANMHSGEIPATLKAVGRVQRVEDRAGEPQADGPAQIARRDDRRDPRYREGTW